MNLFLKRIVLHNFHKFYSTRANTIFALSSGLGKCGVAVIRVSGPDASTALKSLTKTQETSKPRTAILKKIYHPVTNDLLDRGLILWFPGPHSFTGEDCCEFHVHGSVAVLSAVLYALGSLKNLRPAEPGEFTRRAFHHGKMDLTEIEGLSDLLQAETELQRKQALLQTEGILSDIYKNWRTILIKTIANIEAHIDFEETETLESGLLKDVQNQVDILVCGIKSFLADGRKGEVLRAGVKTTIIGEPNVGKSSLFNILCCKPTAIVTPIEGTTRDILESTIDINGYPLILTDTAGLRKSTADIVEQEGINRARKSLLVSDLVILVVDIMKYTKWRIKFPKSNFSLYLKDYLETMNIEEKDFYSQHYMIVINKIDLMSDESIKNVLYIDPNITLMSCKTEEGIHKFIDTLTHQLTELCGTPSKEHPSVNNERQRFLLSSCLEHLELYLNKSKSVNQDIVIMAQHLRSALRDLGKITGHVTTEELLDVIFKDFCIGK